MQLLILIIPQLLAAGNNDLLIQEIGQQLIRKDEVFNGRFPEYTENGIWQFRKNPNWLSGFIGGELWYLYEMTGEEEYKLRALKHADQMIDYATIDYTHDMGFIFMPTCVKSYQMTKDAKYRDAAIKAADMLVKRFNDKGQYIRAWGKLNSNDEAGLMIIDTIMNLELLFWAAQETGNYKYYEIAYRHALTAMKELVRPDGSSFHVVEFDPESGQVLKKFTHQGFADSSTWSRGQAWGIYGFTLAYEYTQDERFLKTAEIMADYFIKHLPKDQVPYWDLSLSEEGTLRDASAGAIAASGFFELADVASKKQEEQKYRRIASDITSSLVNNYLFSQTSRRDEEGILLHTIYHFHKKWGVDESFPAGDYYLIEALKRQWDLEQFQRLDESNSARQIINLNKNWYYLEEAIPYINHLHLVAQEWEKINLPHTWNVTDATDNIPGYRRSTSWYQKEIFIPTLNYDQCLLLSFESVNISCIVLVNGQKVGEHVGGYLGFDVDITPFIKPNEKNIILVKVDNSYNPDIIPSQKSDFFIYGGITRDVWLKVMPAEYIEKILITIPQVSKKSAETSLNVLLNNSRDRAVEGELLAHLIDVNGKVVATVKQNLKLVTGNQEATIIFPKISNPSLWSPVSPNLYTIEVSLNIDGKIVDEMTEKFGYRWFEFKEHGPFYLNGEKFLLRGTHRHEDWAGFGNAIPNELHRKDMQMIKEIGANFVRLAHYPQDPEIYRACDELGLLVWDEVPWCRGGMGGEKWKQNTKNMLKDMIIQNYNHPSIIIWSLGNELDWLPDFENGGNMDSLIIFFSEMNDLVHKLDPYRLTATRKFAEGSNIVDVYSPSIWAGWYSGVYKSYEKILNQSRYEFKHFFHAEYGGSSHLGRHVENPITGEGFVDLEDWEEEVNQVKVQNISQYGDWSENYIVDLFDWYLHISENLDWFAGNAQWAFKDFATPLRVENPIPYMNQKGLVDRAGNPKDAYYVFKSYWTKTPEFCYIESHTWTERNGPKNVPREVCVYSNSSQVELIVNSTSLGTRERNIHDFPACGLYWDVIFKNGQNKLVAVGYNSQGISCRDSIIINYSTKKWGKPDRITLSSYPLSNGRLQIEALVVDKNGHRCLDYNKRVYFSMDGYGKLITNMGTYTGTDAIEMANGRAVIEFIPVPGEEAVIECRNQDFKGSYLRVKK